MITPKKVFSFDGKFNALFPLGKLLKDDNQLNTIWKGFNPKKLPYFTHEDQLFTIEDNKQQYNRYNNKGKFLNKKNPITEVDPEVNINGAPIVLPSNRIAIVSGNQVSLIVCLSINLITISF